MLKYNYMIKLNFSFLFFITLFYSTLYIFIKTLISIKLFLAKCLKKYEIIQHTEYQLYIHL